MKEFKRPDAIKIAKGTCVSSAANLERRARARNHRKLCDAAATGRNDGAARCVRKSQQQQGPVETKAILCKCTEPPTPNSGGWRRVQCSVRLLWRVERRLVAACVCVWCVDCAAVLCGSVPVVLKGGHFSLIPRNLFRFHQFIAPLKTFHWGQNCSA